MDKYLLNFKWKVPGLALLILGLTLAVIYFITNPRIEAPVLAIFSSYMEVKTFAVFKTNIFDEMLLLSLLAGLFLLAFSRDKKERDNYPAIRSQALALAVISNVIIIGLSIFFVFGSGFISILVLNIYISLIIYLIAFNTLKYRSNSQK